MQKTQTELIKQYILEFLRLAVIGLVTWLLTEGAIDWILTTAFGTHLTPEVKTQIVIVVTVLVKALDRALHESKVEEAGLVRF